MLALPGVDDSIRGLTVDAWIVADEAARLNGDTDCRLAPDPAPPPSAGPCSTAWSRSDPFRTAWAGDDPTSIRLKATADSNPSLFAPQFWSDGMLWVNKSSITNTSVFPQADNKSIYVGIVEARDACPRAQGTDRPALRRCRTASRTVEETHSKIREL